MFEVLQTNAENLLMSINSKWCNSSNFLGKNRKVGFHLFVCLKAEITPAKVPEATSVARSSAFNSHVVDKF